MAPLSDLTWDLAQGVTAAPASGAAPAPGWKPIQLTATAEGGMHRIGVDHDFGGGARTYSFDVWVKTSPGLDAMLEARGKTLTGPGQPLDYGVIYYDVGKGVVAPNPLVTNVTRMPNASIAADGEWTKLSGSLRTQDGALFVVVGMVSKGQHVFTGKPDMTLNLGGISIKPQ